MINIFNVSISKEIASFLENRDLDKVQKNVNSKFIRNFFSGSALPRGNN
jgi:hypothetical protein